MLPMPMPPSFVLISRKGSSGCLCTVCFFGFPPVSFCYKTEIIKVTKPQRHKAEILTPITVISDCIVYNETGGIQSGTS